MPKATWNGAVLAESDDTLIVEGNHYFPAEALNKGYFKAAEHSSLCPWKGTASYFDLEVDGEVNKNAAWTYPEPKEKAARIKDYVAFWNGVQVET